jgi:hypothetical protein
MKNRFFNKFGWIGIGISQGRLIMKKMIPLLALLAGLNAHATAYTYCQDGTLYQCGAGDACDPQPCYPIGDCSDEIVRAVQAAGFPVDLEAQDSRITQSLRISAHSCL